MRNIVDRFIIENCDEWFHLTAWIHGNPVKVRFTRTIAVQLCGELGQALRCKYCIGMTDRLKAVFRGFAK